MKKILFFSILIMGCATTAYYQLHEIKSTDVDQSMKFQNASMAIAYDFWAEGGYSKCLVTNKTDSIIFLNMVLSHFIMNGMAFPYYTSMVTYSGHTVSDIGRTYWPYNFSGITINNSHSIAEAKVIILPPHTSKYIPGFNIGKLYQNCDLGKNQDSSGLTFDNKGTPFAFSNLLYYSVGKETSSPRQVNNSFWVSSISNMAYIRFTKEYFPAYCGKTGMYSKTIFPLQAPNRYYFKY